MIQVWRILLIIAVGFLTWRSVLFGITDHYLDQLTAGDKAAAERALSWLPGQPTALFQHALDLMPTDPTVAEALLIDAYARDPTRSLPLLALAERIGKQGDQARADALVEAAAELEPANARTHRAAAAYWLSRGLMDRALRHWSLALEARPATNQDLFDIFLRVAEDPTERVGLKPFALAPPDWWQRFFKTLANRALDGETVRYVYGLRKVSTTFPITPEEREAYVLRLLKEGAIPEAFLTWVNGLSVEERGQMGLLHNGGFELALSNRGFGWHWQPTKSVTANTAATFGLRGQRALQLRFRRYDGRFRHLYQPVFLDPGIYQLTGAVRIDGLESKGGLRWSLACTQPENRVLGESERFLGSSDWHAFSVDFEVPEDCALQEVRLISAGQRSFEQAINGEIWFEDISIHRIAALGAAALAEAQMRARTSNEDLENSGSAVGKNGGVDESANSGDGGESGHGTSKSVASPRSRSKGSISATRFTQMQYRFDKRAIRGF